MLKGFAQLIEQTKEHVAKVRKIKTTGFVDGNEMSCVYNRAIQLCALDSILAQHRIDYGTKFNGLRGREALHHKLLLKYKWPLSEIKALSLPDTLLALHDELKIELLPQDASRILAATSRDQHNVVFPDITEEEWNPEFAEKLLYNSEDR